MGNFDAFLTANGMISGFKSVVAPAGHVTECVPARAEHFNLYLLPQYRLDLSLVP
jgi:hypothetical protein